jgi:hypothetical protein
MGASQKSCQMTPDPAAYANATSAAQQSIEPSSFYGCNPSAAGNAQLAQQAMLSQTIDAAITDSKMVEFAAYLEANPDMAKRFETECGLTLSDVKRFGGKAGGKQVVKRALLAALKLGTKVAGVAASVLVDLFMPRTANAPSSEFDVPSDELCDMYDQLGAGS